MLESIKNNSLVLRLIKYKSAYLLFIANIVINFSFASSVQNIELDGIGRVIKFPGKIEISCPIQDNKTAVLLVLGQSNSANHGAKKFNTRYPSQVFNYFNGKCYIASSPLLGATGTGGEFITPMADKLIDNNDYENVVIVSMGVGGVQIDRWAKGGDLNNIAKSILSEMQSRFHITHIIWHQGESDFSSTTTEQYTQRFYSMLGTFRSYFSYDLPIYYAVATQCGNRPDWTPINAISTAQKLLADHKKRIFLGANTDELVQDEDRDETHCHFGETGQIKTALSYAEAIHKSKI